MKPTAADQHPSHLPDLLLEKGSMEGPFKPTKPWRRSRVRRFVRSLIAFFMAPRPFL